MTDSSSLIANQQALSADVLYNLKPSVVRCRNYRCSISASNKNAFGPHEIGIFSIPCRRNCFLDQQNSYQRFTVKNGDGTYTFKVNSTGYSFIKGLDVYHGSNMLDTIQAYNVLAAYLVNF
jgi:hypothetical protein